MPTLGMVTPMPTTTKLAVTSSATRNASGAAVGTESELTGTALAVTSTGPASTNVSETAGKAASKLAAKKQKNTHKEDDKIRVLLNGAIF